MRVLEVQHDTFSVATRYEGTGKKAVNRSVRYSSTRMLDFKHTHAGLQAHDHIGLRLLTMNSATALMTSRNTEGIITSTI